MKLHMAWLSLLLAVVPLYAQAQPWEFGKPIAVTSTHGEKIFHHLESSGRHNIAISDDTIAVVWEDNRDDMPRVYLARKGRKDPGFSNEIQISGPGEAYEPSLVALSNNRFVVAWEEDTRIHLRLITPTELRPVITLDTGEAMQPSLASRNEELLLVYSRRNGRYSRIWMQVITIDGLALHPEQGCAVDAEKPRDDQLYPAMVGLADRNIVAWEDRRLGHTIIMASQNSKPESCHFQAPQRISEGSPGRSAAYGKGHGVARVALATYGAGQALAVWADKRDFREGYDIYAAHYQPGNKQLFGANIKVQDSFGDVAQQWHATVAGDHSGRLVVAWDDNRDGDANILLSWLEGSGWSDDFTVPGASGSGEQSHPSISLDREGNLHLVWIERTTKDGPTLVRYMFGRANKK